MGCALYQTLTGEVPFSATLPLQVLQQHLHEPVPNVLRVRPDLQRLQPLLAKCLAKDPRERWADATTLAAALRAELAHHEDHLIAGRLADRSAAQSRGIAKTISLMPDTAVTLADSVSTSPSPAAVVRKAHAQWIVGLAGLVAAGILGVYLLRHHGPVTVAPASPTLPVTTLTGEIGTPILANTTIPAGHVSTILDRLDHDITDHQYDAAIDGLADLRATIPAGQLQPQQTVRLAQLDARLKAAQDQIAARLDQADAALTAGDRPTAESLLSVQVPICFDLLVRRRAALRERLTNLPVPKQTKPAGLPTGTVTLLTPLRSEPVQLRALPNLAPMGPQAIVASLHAGTDYQLDLVLPPGETHQDGMVMMLGSDVQQRVTVHAVIGGHPQEIISFTLPERSWSVNTLSLPNGIQVEQVTLVSTTAPFYFVSAAEGHGRLPAVTDLGIMPGTLLVKDLNPLVEKILSKQPTFPNFSHTQLVLPQTVVESPKARAAFVGALNRGLISSDARDAHALSDTALITYQTPADLGAAIAKAVDPHLLLIYLPAGASRAVLQLQLQQVASAPEHGVLPVLLFGPECKGRSKIRPEGGAKQGHLGGVAARA